MGHEHEDGLILANPVGSTNRFARQAIVLAFESVYVDAIMDHRDVFASDLVDRFIVPSHHLRKRQIRDTRMSTELPAIKGPFSVVAGQHGRGQKRAQPPRS